MYSHIDICADGLGRGALVCWSAISSCQSRSTSSRVQGSLEAALGVNGRGAVAVGPVGFRHVILETGCE